MPFAQLIIGPPGSGKSTYADGMHQFLSALGRKCSVVNLDPANEHTNYPCALDIRDLVRLEDVMEEEGLGPNGGVLFALEEVEQEGGWLEGGLRGLGGRWVCFFFVMVFWRWMNGLMCVGFFRGLCAVRLPGAGGVLYAS